MFGLRKRLRVKKGWLGQIYLSGRTVNFKVSKKLKKIVKDWPWYTGLHPDGTGYDVFRCGECGMHIRSTLEAKAGHLRHIHGYRITGEKYE